MSRAQEENIAIKTVGENDEENAYAIVDESKRKSKCDQEGPSSFKGEGMQSPPNDDHTAADQLSLKQNTERCDKGDDQEEKRDHVYAEVFVKESKAAVSGKTTASRDESLQVTCTEDGSNVGKDPVENLNPSFKKRKGTTFTPTCFLKKVKRPRFVKQQLLGMRACKLLAQKTAGLKGRILWRI